MNNILINKNTLNEYLEDFHPNAKLDILDKFKEFNFNCGVSSFSQKMRSIISMPKFGKTTLIYWTSRGWSEEESLLKRKLVKRDPTDSPMNINFWVKRGFSEEDAKIKIKSQRKLNKEYWILRGYNEEDSIRLSNQFQKENSVKFHKKFKSDNNFRESVNSKRSNNINYWLNLGFTEDIAASKISERQSTFSLEKCIKKYGEQVGREVWIERQNKWKNSLKKSDYNNRDNKDSKSIKYFKNKYGENWIETYINKLSFKDKKEILFLSSFKNYQLMIDTLVNDNYNLGKISYYLRYKILQDIYLCKIEDMLQYLVNNYEFKYNTPEYYYKKYSNWVDKFIEDNSFKDKEGIKFLLSFFDYKEMIKYMISNYRITDIIIYLQSKLISYYYKTSYEDMFSFLVSIDPVIKSKYGRIRYFNNHICRSDGEFIIANFLKDNNIEYKYEKKYEKSLKRCDFYLIKYNFYIEFTGMSSILSYKKKYDDKLNFCLKNNINCIFSNNIEEIKNKIKEIYEIKYNDRQT